MKDGKQEAKLMKYFEVIMLNKLIIMRNDFIESSEIFMIKGIEIMAMRKFLSSFNITNQVYPEIIHFIILQHHVSFIPYLLILYL
jgi:hypothetical protein